MAAQCFKPNSVIWPDQPQSRFVFEVWYIMFARILIEYGKLCINRMNQKISASSDRDQPCRQHGGPDDGCPWCPEKFGLPEGKSTGPSGIGFI